MLKSLKNYWEKGTVIMPFYLLNNSNVVFNNKKFNFTKYTGNLVKAFVKEKNIIEVNL